MSGSLSTAAISSLYVNAEPMTYDQRRDHQGKYLLALSVVPAELKFGKVAVQVLHADLVEGAYYPALQKAPVAANRASVNVAPNPFLRGVVDYLVPYKFRQLPPVPVRGCSSAISQSPIAFRMRCERYQAVL